MNPLLNGSKFVDDRGSVSFVNDFNLELAGIQRFYQVENHKSGQIRCWHGHFREAKYVYVPKGVAIVQTISFEGVDNQEKPSRWVLSADNPKILCIPPGHYNGFKTLTDDTIVMFFSTSTLEESTGDDIRLPLNAIQTDGWEVVPR